MKELTEKARVFQALHHAAAFVLPNAWDAISARIFEEAGFLAIGTTSAGMAWSLGYADGQRVPWDELLQALRRIVARVQIPVSADLESGYGHTPQEIVENVRQLMDIGIVGINIEDFTGRAEQPLEEAERQAEKIAAIRALAVTSGVPFVINARIDVLHPGIQTTDDRLAETFRRAVLYRQAGADCIFVFGMHDGDTIRKLAQGIEGPLNIMASPGTPSVTDLASWGVTRISIGPAAIKVALGAVKQIAHELSSSRTFASLAQPSLSYAEINNYFMARRDPS